MDVLYDHREARSGIPGLLALDGLVLVEKALTVGDYVLSDRLVLERKTGADLVASIIDGRLFDQLGRARAAYQQVVLLVEREPETLSSAAWKGALASALRQGVSVLATEDLHDSAQWIARLARQEAAGPSGPRGRPARRKADDPDRLAEQVVASLPGVSVVGARRLLGHFGSVSALFAAGEEDLRVVAGIGPVRARALARAFRGRYGDSPANH